MDRYWSIKIQSRLSCGQGCFEVSKFMIRLRRHDESVHREEDGAVRFDELAELCKSSFEATSHWTIQALISFLAKGGGQKKMFQHCLNRNSSEHVLYCWAIQGHFGGTLVDPTLQDKVLLTDDFAEHISPRRERSQHALHHPVWVDSGRKIFKKGQAIRVFHNREPDVHPSESRRSSIRHG